MIEKVSEDFDVILILDLYLGLGGGGGAVGAFLGGGAVRRHFQGGPVKKTPCISIGEKEYFDSETILTAHISDEVFNFSAIFSHFDGFSKLL